MYVIDKSTNAAVSKTGSDDNPTLWPLVNRRNRRALWVPWRLPGGDALAPRSCLYRSCHINIYILYVHTSIHPSIHTHIHVCLQLNYNRRRTNPHYFEGDFMNFRCGKGGNLHPSGDSCSWYRWRTHGYSGWFCSGYMTCRYCTCRNLTSLNTKTVQICVYIYINLAGSSIIPGRSYVCIWVFLMSRVEGPNLKPLHL